MKHGLVVVALLGLLPGCGTSDDQSCIDARSQGAECGVSVPYVMPDDCIGATACKQECLVGSPCDQLAAAQNNTAVINDYTRCLASCG